MCRTHFSDLLLILDDEFVVFSQQRKTKKKRGNYLNEISHIIKTYIRIAATTTRPDRPFNPVSNSTSLLRFFPLTILRWCYDID